MKVEIPDEDAEPMKRQVEIVIHVKTTVDLVSLLDDDTEAETIHTTKALVDYVARDITENYNKDVLSWLDDVNSEEADETVELHLELLADDADDALVINDNED